MKALASEKTAQHDGKVVVVLIVYQEALSPFEKISLDQCLKVFQTHPIRIVKPESLDVTSWQTHHPDLAFENFPDQYFRDIGAYSRMLISRTFYKRFERFEFLLIYQLDAFVFRDDLLLWCNLGYDYIGAPWFEGFSSTNPEAAIVGVGNGGFSLRKVKAHLKVLNSFSYITPPGENWKKRVEERPEGKGLLSQIAGFLLDLTIRNNTFWLLNSFKGFEDQFWGLVAARNFKWFKLAGVKDAMKFSIEMQPRRVIQMTDSDLPFGCHAWWKYDLEFWRPYIENCGYRLSLNNTSDVTQ